MLKFIANTEKEEHDNFVKNHPLSCLLQSSKWADVKFNWGNAIVGVKDGDELVASALVLIKTMPGPFCAMYIPRGPILDYENKDLVTFFFSELKKWAKKKHCVFIKFDPGIIAAEYKLKEKDNVVYNDAMYKALENIKSIGAVHNGFTKNIHDSTQPRYQMGIYKCENFEAAISKDARKSKNAAIKKHVKVARYGEDKLEEFAKLMQMTGERKGINLRDLEYFKRLMNTYGDDAYLFLTSVNPHIRGKEVTDRITEVSALLNDENVPNGTRTQLERELADLNGELEAMKEVLDKYEGETYIAGALMIGFGDNCEMLYAGMNKDFRSFKPQYLSHFLRFQFLFDEGYNYASMGGIEGTLDDGLTLYKSKYNSLVREYIGEFDLPVDKILYKAYSVVKDKI